ncbi:MAG: sigma-70 family RNA polymerase sigma factor [Phycisphaerales bacterium]|nr:sigma-70 family RNA polymerase sigma factor [Phycisphaerales bacterium]
MNVIGRPSADTSDPGALGPEAFAARFETAWRTLWCIAAGVLGSPQHAEDVVQDAAVIGLQKLGDFDPATNFTAWMGRIVRNLALNDARRRQRRRTYPQNPTTIDETRSAALTTADPTPIDGSGRIGPGQHAFDDEVMCGLRQLDDTARACLLLRTIMDMTYRDIARTLDIPEGTAMSHVHRARRSLREHLIHRDPATTAAGGDAP